MTIANSVLRTIFDGVLHPFRDVPALVGVTVMSVVTAVIMLLVFRYASDQKKMAAVKRQIHACIFEIRLFNDDLRAIVRAQVEILKHNLTYVRLTLKPMLFMIVPIVVIIAQMQFHYGYRGLRRGEDAVLTVTFKNGKEPGSLNGNGSRKPAVRIEAPSGLRVETDSVWIPSLNEMAWRLGAERAGEYELEIVHEGETHTKSVSVSEDIRRRSPIRLEPGFLNQLLYPAEDPLPEESRIRSIELAYPEADVDAFGWRVHWLIVFFILSIAFAFVLKGVFRVTI